MNDDIRPQDLARWADEGIIHRSGFFTPEEIAAVNHAVDTMWVDKPRRVTTDDIDTGHRCRMSALSDDARAHRVKISDLYLVDPSVRELLLVERLMALVGVLLDDSPVLCNSLNLEKSSAQAFHADSVFMTPRTPGKLVACWIALEDVAPGSGPLRYYPGSHLIPPFRFSHGGYHHVADELPRWAANLEAEVESRGLASRSVHAAAGDLIVWHSDLVHGAEPIDDPALTRKSLVSHYFALRDCRQLGYRIEPSGDAYWVKRRPQPVDFATRIACAVERRLNLVRAALRGAEGHRSTAGSF